MSAIRRYIAGAVALGIGTIATTSHAHKASDAHVILRPRGQKLEVRWDIALRDLDDALSLDSDGDSELRWGEVRAKKDAIVAYALPQLRLTSNAHACVPDAPTSLGIVTHSDGAYAALEFTCSFEEAVRTVDVDYALFFDIDAQHRGLVRLEVDGHSTTSIARASERRVHLEANQSGVLGRMVSEGIHHIWTGYDHLAFLLALLLPAVLRRREPGNEWESQPAFRPVLLDVLRVVTAFTIAHSLTLSVAGLGFFRLSSRLVESGIALSVIAAALNNVWPLLGRGRWKAAFALGLLHGFAFSETLQDLGLSRTALLVPLFGFNLGVEVGQLAVVALFLPLAFLARRKRAYTYFMVGGSLLVAALGAVWFIERAFVLRLLPFS